MLRSEQIANAKFTPVSKGTYSADEVDSFLKSVAQSYDEVLSQNSELVKKISILADKIESYRNDEEAIKMALLDAHKMAENVSKSANEKAAVVVDDAEKKAAIITDDANAKANTAIVEAREQAKSIVDNAKNAVASLTQRAQSETEKAISAAQEKAQEIIAEANKKAAAIVGNSKEEYAYYTGETEKIRAETAKFKTTVEAICNSQLGLLASVPEFKTAAAEFVPSEEYADNTEAEEAPAAKPEEAIIEEVIEEVIAPETQGIAEEAEKEAEEEAPEADAEEIISVEEIEEEEKTEAESAAAEEEEPVLDGELDDLLSFLGDTGSSEDDINIASSLDDFIPVLSAEASETEEDISSVSAPEVSDEPAENEDDIEEFNIDFGNIDDIEFDDDVDKKDDDDDDITSLFADLFDE